MKDGRCPMCNSTEVYANPKACFRAGVYYLDLDDEFDVIPFVCVSCGFAAMYVETMEELKDLTKAKGWSKVPTA